MTDNTSAERQRRYMARIRGVTDAKLREENAELKRQLAEALAKQPPADTTVSDTTVSDAKLREEIAELKADNDRLQEMFTKTLFERDEALAKKREWSEAEQVKELQRQIKGLRTRMKNMELEHLERMRRHIARGTKMTRAQYRTLLNIFHPDTGTRATEEQLTEAMQVFNSIQFNVK